MERVGPAACKLVINVPEWDKNIQSQNESDQGLSYVLVHCFGPDLDRKSKIHFASVKCRVKNKV